MNKANILVLDDDPVVRRALTDVLTDEGYQVATAADGLEGLEKAKGQEFNLALVDIRLPDVSGLQVLQALKEMAPDVEVLIITAYPDLETAIVAVRLGAYDYVVKPFANADLLLRVRNALEKQRLTLAHRQLLQETTSTLESMLDAVIVTNLDGAIHKLNQAALELLGYAEQEFIGQPVGIIFEEEAAAAFFRGAGLAQLVREGAARDVEMTLRTRSGERIPVVVNGSAIQGDDSQLLGVVGVARDARERKQAEEALRESEERLRTVVTGAPIFLFALDREGVVEVAQGEGLAALGLKPDEVVGRSAFDIYPDVPEVVQAIHHALAGQKVTATGEMAGVWIEARLSPLRDENGKVVGVIGVSTDVTKRLPSSESTWLPSRGTWPGIWRPCASGFRQSGAKCGLSSARPARRGATLQRSCSSAGQEGRPRHCPWRKRHRWQRRRLPMISRPSGGLVQICSNA